MKYFKHVMSIGLTLLVAIYFFCSPVNASNPTLSVETSIDREEVSRKIRDGDVSAINYAYKNIDKFDGGDLEDLYISTALLFDRDPVLFFDLMKNNKVEDLQIVTMLTMLPLSYVDNYPDQIKAYKTRLALLKSARNIDDTLRGKIESELCATIKLLRSP